MLYFTNLAPEKRDCKWEFVICPFIPLIDPFNIFYEIILRVMPGDIIDDKSALVQVMTKAPSHHRDQGW